MSIRVIVHQAPEDAEPGSWDAYIQGHRDAFRVESLAALNHQIRELALEDPVYYGAVACDAPVCGLAATGTILWRDPGVYHLAPNCDEHLELAAADADRLGYPHTTLAEPVPVAQDYFSEVSLQDMAALARALIAYEIPAEVFTQPVCALCETRICLLPGSMRWAGADSDPECEKGENGHILAAAESDDTVGDENLAELALVTPDR